MFLVVLGLAPSIRKDCRDCYAGTGILTDLDISLYPPIEEDTTIGSFLAIFFRSVSLINRLLKNPSESFDMLRTNGNAY
jgi:hypothetical protein